MVERKKMTFPVEIKSCEEQGLISGYASVFNVVDSHSDIIAPGAFSNATSKCKLLWQHEQEMPIGVIKRIYEDDYGLFIEAKILLDVAKGKETYSLIKNNVISGLSIGFVPKQFHIDYENDHRILTEVDLWEISFVTFPSNPMASITSVKSENGNEKLLSSSIERAIEILEI